MGLKKRKIKIGRKTKKENVPTPMSIRVSIQIHIRVFGMRAARGEVMIKAVKLQGLTAMSIRQSAVIINRVKHTVLRVMMAVPAVVLISGRRVQNHRSAVAGLFVNLTNLKKESHRWKMTINPGEAGQIMPVREKMNGKSVLPAVERTPGLVVKSLAGRVMSGQNVVATAKRIHHAKILTGSDHLPGKKRKHPVIKAVSAGMM
jgi:hypothetical protein